MLSGFVPLSAAAGFSLVWPSAAGPRCKAGESRPGWRKWPSGRCGSDFRRRASSTWTSAPYLSLSNLRGSNERDHDAPAGRIWAAREAAHAGAVFGVFVAEPSTFGSRDRHGSLTAAEVLRVWLLSPGIVQSSRRQRGLRFWSKCITWHSLSAAIAAITRGQWAADRHRPRPTMTPHRRIRAVRGDGDGRRGLCIRR